MKPSPNSLKTLVWVACVSYAFLMVATYFMTQSSAKPLTGDNPMLPQLILAGSGAIMVVGSLIAMKGIGGAPEEPPLTVPQFKMRFFLALAILETPVLVTNFVFSQGMLDPTSRILVVAAGVVMIGLFVLPRALVTLNTLRS